MARDHRDKDKATDEAADAVRPVDAPITSDRPSGPYRVDGGLDEPATPPVLKERAERRAREAGAADEADEPRGRKGDAK